MRKVLIADDNEDSRELVKKILKKEGFEIIEAIDGEEAIVKAIAHRPDLILMDISMPKIDGYEATRRLKERLDFKDVPIIALTAHAMRGDQEKALQAGFNGYISKPINVREFVNEIKIYLKDR